MGALYETVLPRRAWRDVERLYIGALQPMANRLGHEIRTKLGYVRGDAEDGGSFSIYYKPFRSERIQAVVEFTGSYMPEQDIPAVIRELYFVPLKPNDSIRSWNPNKLWLGKVPPVLISESNNDVREMAAEGTGFDPAWEKKGLW